MREVLSGSKSNSLITAHSSWDSIAFERKVEVLQELTISDYANFEREAHSAIQALSADGVSLVTARISSSRTHDLQKLQNVGFCVVETTFSPAFIGGLGDTIPSEFVVRNANSQDLQAIMMVAHEAFTVSRFHNDPYIPDAMANRRYENWVKSTASSESQELLSIVNANDELVGFFISETTDHEAYWHLTALARPFRGRGLAAEVWKTVMQFQSQLGVTSFRTTISGANIRVVNLYPRLGFRLENPQTSLHLHL
jgi:RimJ/RimL family protein N-acetyltransferase